MAKVRSIGYFPYPALRVGSGPVVYAYTDEGGTVLLDSQYPARVPLLTAHHWWWWVRTWYVTVTLSGTADFSIGYDVGVGKRYTATFDALSTTDIFEVVADDESGLVLPRSYALVGSVNGGGASCQQTTGDVAMTLETSGGSSVFSLFTAGAVSYDRAPDEFYPGALLGGSIGLGFLDPTLPLYYPPPDDEGNFPPGTDAYNHGGIAVSLGTPTSPDGAGDMPEGLGGSLSLGGYAPDRQTGTIGNIVQGESFTLHEASLSVTVTATPGTLWGHN